MADVQSTLVRVSAAGAEPLQLDDVKLWLRVSFPDDDALILGLMTAARQYSEKFCRRSFLLGEQWQLSLDHFPTAYPNDDGFYQTEQYGYGFPTYWSGDKPKTLAIELPNGPVTSINQFSYTDPSGAAQSLPSSAYVLVADDDGTPRLYPSLAASGGTQFPYYASWPTSQFFPQAVQILYTAGVVIDATLVIAMKQMVAHWYADREAVIMQAGVTPQNVPFAAEALLWPYRLIEF